MNHTPRFTRVLTDPAVIRYLESTPANRITFQEKNYGGRPSRSAVANGGRPMSQVVTRSGSSSTLVALPREYWQHVDLAKIPEPELIRCAKEIATVSRRIGRVVHPPVAAGGAESLQ